MIDLSRCTTVKSADLKSHKKHSFEISTPETTYLLYAGELYFSAQHVYVIYEIYQLCKLNQGNDSIFAQWDNILGMDR